MTRVTYSPSDTCHSLTSSVSDEVSGLISEIPPWVSGKIAIFWSRGGGLVDVGFVEPQPPTRRTYRHGYLNTQHSPFHYMDPDFEFSWSSRRFADEIARIRPSLPHYVKCLLTQVESNGTDMCAYHCLVSKLKHVAHVSEFTLNETGTPTQLLIGAIEVAHRVGIPIARPWTAAEQRAVHDIEIEAIKRRGPVYYTHDSHDVGSDPEGVKYPPDYLKCSTCGEWDSDVQYYPNINCWECHECMCSR